MNLLDHPLFKTLNKISPDLIPSLISAGQRQFTNIKIDGDMASDIWAIKSSGTDDNTQNFGSSLVNGNSAFTASLLQTPNLRFLKSAKGHILTNSDLEIGGNPYSYKPFDYEPRLGLTTSYDVVNTIGCFEDASFASRAGGLIKITPTLTGADTLESLCGMFGLEYLREMPVVMQVVNTSDNDYTETKIKAGNKMPTAIMSLGVPGVKYFLVGVPNSQQTYRGMWNSPENSNYSGVEGMKWFLRYKNVNTRALNGLRAAWGTQQPAANPSESTPSDGKGEIFWFGIPVLSDESAWSRMWFADCTGATYNNGYVGMGRTWHCGYNDSRYSKGTLPSLFAPQKDATATVSAGVLPVDLKGGVMTSAELTKSYQGKTAANQQFYTPLIGVLGDINFIAESTTVSIKTEEVTFEDEPDRVFVFETITMPYNRLGVKFTRAWYEHYYSTGFGIYAPRASNIQANTLKTWTTDDISALGVVSYNEPLQISGSMVDQLQARQTYKKTKEKACEKDDWDQQNAAIGVTWAHARTILDSAGPKATFYSPVFGQISVGSSLTLTDIVSAKFSRSTTDGPLDVTLTKRDGSATTEVKTTEEARQLYLELSGIGIVPKLVNWVVELDSTEQAAILETRAEAKEINTYGSYDRRFIGMSMMLTYQFPWESLSKGGYPCVKEMPRQNAIMATIQSVVYYERFGAQLKLLWQKLSANALITKVMS